MNFSIFFFMMKIFPVWLTIFRYFPGIVFIFVVLSVYILARRQGFGWEAALFTALIPTTVGILGPAFMVPVAMGLIFFPLCLFLVFNFRTGWSYLVLFIFISFLLSIHAATAVGLAIVLAPYILLNLKGSFKHSLWITLAIVIPFLAPFPWIFAMLKPTLILALSFQALPTYIDFPRVILTYGYLPIACALLGTFLLVIQGGKKNLGLILGLLALLVMLVTYYTFHFGVSIMYQRGLMYMMLMLSIVAGAGLAGVRKFRLPGKFIGGAKTAILAGNASNILCLVVVGAILAIGIPNRQNLPYYHMVDSQDYHVFTWIRNNVDENYKKAILDPWKATAFTAITGKKVYSRIHTYPTASDEEAYKFLRNGCTDTEFLKNNNISLVYTQWDCNNSNLEKVREKVYLFKEKALP